MNFFLGLTSIFPSFLWYFSDFRVIFSKNFFRIFQSIFSGPQEYFSECSVSFRILCTLPNSTHFSGFPEYFLQIFEPKSSENLYFRSHLYFIQICQNVLGLFPIFQKKIDSQSIFLNFKYFSEFCPKN